MKEKKNRSFGHKKCMDFAGKGSITVEAAFLVPFCFFGILFLLYVGMYLHDWYIIETVIRTAAERELRYVLQEESVEDGTFDWTSWGEKTMLWYWTEDFQEEEDFLQQYIVTNLKGKLLLGQLPEIAACVSADRVQVSYRCSLEGPMGHILSDLKGDVQAEGISMQEWVRMCRGLLDSEQY